jgi:hypothetical protein
VPQYGSKFRAFRVNIRPKVEIPHPTMPVILETIPDMVAEFGIHLPEVEVEIEGSTERYGQIVGNFYDLDADAEAKGWTEDEYKIAQARLDALCETWPEAIWKLEPAVPTAPWATYDATDAKKVAILAGELNLAGEALAYEKATLNRKQVVTALEEVAEMAAVEEELTAK